MKNGEGVGGGGEVCLRNSPLMLMPAGWELASKQGGTYYPPDTYKPSTFYCPFPFIVRGKGKTQSMLTVQGQTHLISLSGGNLTGKRRGQINCVVLG